MTDELTQAAMTTWAARHLPARLLAAQVAKLLNCSTEDTDTLERLSATHARLFKAWQVLTATPNPGSLRPRKSQRPEPPPLIRTAIQTPQAPSSTI